MQLFKMLGTCVVLAYFGDRGFEGSAFCTECMFEVTYSDAIQLAREIANHALRHRKPVE